MSKEEKAEQEISEEEKAGECKIREEVADQYRSAIPGIVREIVGSCNNGVCFDHVGPEPIPSRQSVIEILHLIQRILYPGYFTSKRIDPVNLEYYLGQEVTTLFERLSEQIILAIRHDCLRYEQPCTHCSNRGRESALDFLKQLSHIRRLLANDVQAAYEGDPAAKRHDEIIYSYPGIFAISVYRMAHALFEHSVPLLPRIMTEYAHSLTGIDIHPGAHIGECFFIDHGTGVVIGETTIIGNRVRIYQGVTLGALSLPKGAGALYRNRKRHPTIEDDVIIYSGATILGGDTVIGARSVVGGNVWITESIPPDTKVILRPPELIYKGSATSDSQQGPSGE